jgi:small subunit ribosomal protein S24e
MDIKITSVKENPLLKRREVRFSIEHGPKGKTPGRIEVRKALAAGVETDTNLVFVQEMETRTGTNTTLGFATIYESADQAKLVEPEYVMQRNNPKPKEEAKE